MKKFNVIAVAAVMLITGLSQLQAEEPPVVINATWRAQPGEVIGIYGAHLGSPETAEVVATPLTNDAASFRLPVINAHESVLQAMLPSEVQPDIYSVIVNTPAGQTRPVFINRAEPWWLSERTAYAGQRLRLIGRNFIHPAHRPADSISRRLYAPSDILLELVQVGGAERIAVNNIFEMTDFIIEFEVPAAATVGRRYTVRVSNGAGGEAGWAELDDERGLYIVAGGDDPLDLQAAWAAEIPWGQRFDVREFGARRDGPFLLTFGERTRRHMGVTEADTSDLPLHEKDDTAAIQSAIATAAEAGGGVVYFPAGTYHFTQLTIPSRVVLMGQGADVTRLVYTGRQDDPGVFRPFSGSYGGAHRLIIAEGSALGIAHLTIESHDQRPDDDWLRRIGGWVTAVSFHLERGGFLKHVRVIVADGGAVRANGQSDLIIEDCDIRSAHGPLHIRMHEGYIRIRNNTTLNQQRPGIIGPGPRAIIEGNAMIGDPVARPIGVSDAHGTTEHRITDFSPESLYIADNLFGGTWGKPNSNEGEGLCWQPIHRLAYSRVTGAESSTLADDSQEWQPDSMLDAKVAIVAGRGIGQLRVITANDAGSITVDKPWDVLPDASSVYTIDRHVTRGNIIAGNRIPARVHKGGIVLYGKDYDNIVVDNHLENTGGIWLTSTQVLAQRRADFSYFAYVAGNSMRGAAVSPQFGNGKGNHVTIGSAADGGVQARPDPGLPSVGVYGNEFRRNVIVGIGTDVEATNRFNESYVEHSGIFVSSTSNIQHPCGQGLIIERNRVTNTIAGVHLRNTSYDTVLHGNIFTGNGTEISNRGSIRTFLIEDDAVRELQND